MTTTTTTRSTHLHGSRFAFVAPLAEETEAVVETTAVTTTTTSTVAARPLHVHGRRFAAVAPVVSSIVEVEAATEVATAVEVVVAVEVAAPVGVELEDHQLDDDIAVTMSGAMVRVALNVRTGARVVLVTVDGDVWHRAAFVPNDVGDDEALLAVEETVQAKLAELQTALLPQPSPAFIVAGLVEAVVADDVSNGVLWDRWRTVSGTIFRAPTLVPERRVVALAV